MTPIEKFRKKNPAYSNRSDMDLAQALHRKHYPDMDFNEFASSFGVAQAAPIQAVPRETMPIDRSDVPTDVPIPIARQQQPQSPNDSFPMSLEDIQSNISIFPESGAQDLQRRIEPFVAPLEVLTSMGTGTAGQLVGGLSGGFEAAYPSTSSPPGSGAQVTDAIVNAMTYQPRLRGSQRIMEKMRPLGELLAKPGEVAGEFGLEHGTLLDATLLNLAPSAAASLVGLGPARSFMGQQSISKQLVGEKAARGDIGGAKHRADPATGRIVADSPAKNTIKQGFDEGVVASIKTSSPADKRKMTQMVNILKRGKENKRYAMDNYPGQVAGDSLMDRYRAVRKANRTAGNELEPVANTLKGQYVDPSPAVNNLLTSLDKMGIKFDSKLRPIFKGSDIEGIAPAETVIKDIISRMRGEEGLTIKPPDAYEFHRLKKHIDEKVTYGKQGEGLTGKTERVLKDFRRDLDGILDENFPEYNRVNTTYAETIDALDSIQDVAGRKMDLTGPNADKAVGVLLRRLMSNAQSRVTLMDAIDQLSEVSGKYGKKKFTDDIKMQVLFADELDRKFGPTARASFQGQVDQSIQRGVEAASGRGGLVDLTAKLVGKAAEKARGINDPNAIRAMENLLKGK